MLPLFDQTGTGLRRGPKGPRTKKEESSLLLMAEAYYRKGEFEEALTLFERGKRMRPSITAFQIGVYKCEQAIENNCGMDCNLELGPDVDLTAYYLHAFPPKVTRKAPEKKMGSKVVSVSKKAEKWPIDMPPEILNTLFGKAYPEYVYLRQLYEVEGKREKFLKQTGITLMPTVLPRIQRCEDNRKDVMACANCLNRKCDLWYKMDPSMKHDSRLM
ncbi:hypothetical protein AAHC03_01107 [Spirometra sp. Aus1]|nr:unnamed protein product [Spirometra erinaceieuropaei]